MNIKVKRVYDTPSPDDGRRILVDRIWPRGIRKENARIDAWAKDIAPSQALRRWFGHAPARWEAFQGRYFSELETKPEAWRGILEQARKGPLTLLYAASDTEHNNAVALRAYLQRKARRIRRVRSKRKS